MPESTTSRAVRRATLTATSLLALGCGTALNAQAGVQPEVTAAIANQPPVSAEASPAPQQADAPSGAEIVVTASRVQRDGYSAPTPTTIVGAEAIAARGANNIGAVLNELPAFKASTSATTNGVRSIVPGAVYADLRGLGQTRTLVLVDGNRFVPEITTGLGSYQVDLNQIPTLMIERTEVVTGGASAQWGSDAVAGVVNIILKKNFTGFQSEAQYGVSEQGDNREYRLGLLGGAKLGERGHLVAGIDFVDNKGIGDVFTRSWGRKAYGILTNPCPLAAAVSATCPAGGNGQAQQLIVPDVRFSASTPGGIINNTTGPAAALRGITFGPGGALGQFGYGNYVGTQLMQGGSSNALLNLNDGVRIEPASRRLIGYARASYELTDDVEFHVEGSYAHSRGASQTLPPRNEQTTAITVQLDNPYIPTALRTIITAYNATHAAAPITSFAVGRYSRDIGRGQGTTTNDTYRAVAGLDGHFGSGWKWNVNYVYGRNAYNQSVRNDRILARFNYAADVTTNALGVPVCRGVLNGVAAAAGCVPLNIFGEGSPTADAGSYVTGTLTSFTHYTQNDANANLSGEPFATWAGPVSIAIGGEWRHERQRTGVDPIADAAGYETTNARSFGGSFTVKEAYAETVVPLAKDFVLARSLDLNGAVRVADYSTSAGTQVTWKAGATWQPVADILFRVVRSRDIRAPNIFEQNTPPVSTILNTAFTRSIDGGPTGNVATQQLIGGNANLQPEKANTFTAGVVLTPHWVRGLSLSVDYYNIVVRGAIVALGAANVVTNCTVNSDPYYCSFITRLPAGGAASYVLNTPYQNFSRQNRSGLDFDVTYRRRLQDLAASLPGTMTLHFSGNYVRHYREDATGTGYIERAGETSGNGSPHWLTTSSVTYDVKPVSVTLQMRTIEHGRYNNTFVEGVNINNNSVPGRTYLNLSGSVDIGRNLQIFGVVNNLTDRDPPLAPQTMAYPTVPAYFDMIGRTYRAGVRARF